MKCKNCGAELKTRKCDYCNTEMSPREFNKNSDIPSQPRKSTKNIIIGSAVCVVLLAALLISQKMRKDPDANSNTDTVNAATSEAVTAPQSTETQAKTTEAITESSEGAEPTEVNSEESTDGETEFSGEITGATSLSYEFIDDGLIQDYIAEGTYKCGADFEPGEYYIYGYTGQSPSVKLESAMDEGKYMTDDMAIFKKMALEEGDYIKMYSGLIMFPADDLDTERYNEYGIFTVGKDILPGEYRVTIINDLYPGKFGPVQGTQLGGIEIYESSIDEKPLYSTIMFDEQYIVELEAGQLVALVNVNLEQM